MLLIQILGVGENESMVESKSRQRFVLKLSGSLFGRDASAATLKNYAKLLQESNLKFQPIVIAGGGNIARHYINLARSLGSDEATLDIIGIEVSRLNARLLISALGDEAYPVIPRDLEEISEAAVSDRIVVTGGLHPGQSTNATSALIAEKLHASFFINATDVDGIYDKDPNSHSDAKLYGEITVQECLKILGDGSSNAGTYDLMDIVALKVIERSRIKTTVMKSNVESILKVLEGQNIGTRIAVRKPS